MNGIVALYDRAVGLVANAFGVFVANDEHARFVAIPGAQEGRPAAVDLPAETLIVVRGHTRLQDGDSLDINRE